MTKEEQVKLHIQAMKRLGFDSPEVESILINAKLDENLDSFEDCWEALTAAYIPTPGRLPPA